MSIIDVLLSKIEIVDFVREYTDLIPDSNGVYRGTCPIHKGSNPTSLCVFESGSYYCHSCGSHGNGINFYADMEGLAFYQAIDAIADKYNIDLGNDESFQKQKSIVKENTIALNRFHKHAEVVQEFLIKKRGLTQETIDEFMIGYCDDPNFLRSKYDNTIFKGIIFGIHDIYGRVVGFSKRRTDSDTKPTYINSKDNDLFKKGSLLFNLNRARRRLKDTKKLYVCEGYMDSISAHQQGLAACAYIGGTLTKNQVELLKEVNQTIHGLTFIFAPDNPNIDETGAKELPRIRDKLIKSNTNLNARVPVFPDDCKDFNDCLVKGYDIGNLETKHIDIAVLELLLKQCENPEQEYQVVSDFIRTVKNKMIKADIAVMLAKRWNKEITDVKQFIDVEVNTNDEIMSDIHDCLSCFKDLDDLLQSEGLGLGWKSLDETMDGTRKKEIIILSGYSSSGKTGFSCDVIMHKIIREKQRVVMFSQEMSRGAFMEVLMGKILAMNPFKLKKHLLTKEGNDLYNKVLTILSDYLYVVDRSGLDIKDMIKYVQMINTHKKPIDFVVFDHFHLIPGIADNKTAEDNANLLKEFVKDYNCNIMMLAQFNEESQRFYKGEWREPSMTNIRGANALKAIADTILLIWRPYLVKNYKDEFEREEEKYLTKLKLAKHRRGIKDGIYVDLIYNKDTSRLEEHDLTNVKEGVQ